VKKAYIVTYINDKEGINRQLMQEQLQTIGAYKELSHAARTASWMIIPDDEAANASAIKNKLFSALKPFEDSISVVRIDANDAAGVNCLDTKEFLEKCKVESSDEPRNFERFRTKHEAFLQYELEKPRWVYEDGIGAAILVEFDEWCWLPIRKDGIYDKRKYQSYIYS
jgi:hypothetical protein